MSTANAPRPRTSSNLVDSWSFVSSIDETIHSLRNHLAQSVAAHEHIRLDLLLAGVSESIITHSYKGFHNSINNHVDALQNIRDSIRMQYDKLDITDTKVDMMTLLDSCVMYLYYQATTVQPGSIHIIESGQESVFVQCDGLRIRRVFQFLLGMSTISLPAVVNVAELQPQIIRRRSDADRYVRVHRTREWAECKIVDEGFVLSTVAINHLRESLEAPLMSAAPHDYTVLTLALCKQIVAVHGGSLRITSFCTPGGLCITVRLPLAAAPQNQVV